MIKTVKHAESYFPRFMSKCCSAETHTGICMECGNAAVMPFYFVATKPIPDAIAICREKQLRAQLPVGASIVGLISL